VWVRFIHGKPIGRKKEETKKGGAMKIQAQDDSRPEIQDSPENVNGG
jgi:hypothetical protein